MTFPEALRAAGIADGAALQPELWAASQARATSGPPAVLGEEFLGDAAALMEWKPEFAAAVRASAARLRVAPAWCRLLHHAHDLLFRPGAPAPKGTWIFPESGEDAPMFPLFALLSGLPDVRAAWDRRGIPRDTQRETLSDLELWATVYRANHGVWGFDNLGWLMFHFGGKLIRLGRLQFLPGTMIRFAYVFRHRSSARVQLLCPDGIVYNAAGWTYWKRGERDEPNLWTSSFVHADGIVRGSPITEGGTAMREPITLRDAEWERILAPGDPVLELHIPAGEPLTEASCRASVDRAREFFPRHDPEHPFHGFTCWAWLLDPFLQKILPPAANLVRFQKLFHLFPASGNDQIVLERIFGEKRPDLTHGPRGNRLRDAVRDYMNAGGTFAGGGGGVWRESDERTSTSNLRARRSSPPVSFRAADHTQRISAEHCRPCR